MIHKQTNTPVSAQLLNALSKTAEIVELVKFENVVPHFLCHPCGAWVGSLSVLVHHLPSSQEELEVLVIQLVLPNQDLDANLECKQQLVPLEESTTRVVVHRQ